MSQLLLINPRRRSRRKNPTAAQRRARARFAAMAKARANPARRRRRNQGKPGVVSLAANPRRRRRNPLAAARRVMRRRRNPAMLSAGGIMGPIQQAAMLGAGAVAFDILHAQLRRFLPASMVPVPGQVGIGDAVQAIGTVIIGRALRGPTRGLSMKAATGALTVQAHSLIRSFVPAGMGLGYAGPASIANMNARIGPNRAVGMGAYTRPGSGTPLLNAYTGPGSSPLLSGSRSTRAREGVSIR